MHPSTTFKIRTIRHFLAVGRVDRRKNRIVLVFQVSASPTTSRIGRIEGQLGKEPLAGPIAGGNLP